MSNLREPRTRARRGMATPLLAVALCVSFTPGCKNAAPGSSDSEAVASAVVTLTKEQEIALRALEQRLKSTRWTFPSEELGRQDNRPLFLYLAAKGERPQLVGAALLALRTIVRQEGAKSAEPAVLEVTKGQLQSEDPRVLGRALQLARLLAAAEVGGTELVTQIVELGKRHTEGAGRQAVLDALSDAPQSVRTSAVLELVVDSLGSKEPSNVSTALYLLQRGHKAIEDEGSVTARVLPLLGHTDPGVRGRALSLLTIFDPTDAKLVTPSLQALGDPHPYVRAEACNAVARLEARQAVHHLMPLLDDRREAEHSLVGFATLEGTPGRLNHRTTNGPSVAESALAAIGSLVGRGFTVDLENRKALEANIRKSKEWYEANRATLPEAPPEVAMPTPPQVEQASPSVSPAGTGTGPSAERAPETSP